MKGGGKERRERKNSPEGNFREGKRRKEKTREQGKNRDKENLKKTV